MEGAAGAFSTEVEAFSFSSPFSSALVTSTFASASTFSLATSLIISTSSSAAEESAGAGTGLILRLTGMLLMSVLMELLSLTGVLPSALPLLGVEDFSPEAAFSDLSFRFLLDLGVPSPAVAAFSFFFLPDLGVICGVFQSV